MHLLVGGGGGDGRSPEAVGGSVHKRSFFAARIRLQSGPGCPLPALGPDACAAHLGVTVEVPEVQAPHPVHAGKERGMHRGPHDIVHIVCIVFKGVERLVVL